MDTDTTPTTENLTVPASAMLPGDYLSGSRQTVVRVTRFGLRIPSGKCEVVLRRDNGTVRTATWGAHTKIGVTRAVGNA